MPAIKKKMLFPKEMKIKKVLFTKNMVSPDHGSLKRTADFMVDMKKIKEFYIKEKKGVSGNLYGLYVRK